MPKAGQRKAALEAGATRYFTGTPCLRGHVAERFVSTKACVECALVQSRSWRQEHPEKGAEYGARWKQENPEKAREGRRRRYVANPAKFYAWAKRRKLSLKQRTPIWADHAAIGAIYAEAHNRRLAGEDVVVDHVVPLNGRNVCGLHVHTNLQIIDAQANRLKSNIFSEKDIQNGLFYK